MGINVFAEHRRYFIVRGGGEITPCGRCTGSKEIRKGFIYHMHTHLTALVSAHCRNPLFVCWLHSNACNPERDPPLKMEIAGAE